MNNIEDNRGNKDNIIKDKSYNDTSYKYISIIFMIVSIVCIIAVICSIIVRHGSVDDNYNNDSESVKQIDTTTIAFGDSTMSLASGKKIDDRPCRQEKNTWVELLGVDNYSCPGNSIYDTFDIIDHNDELKNNPDKVFLTIGTNTLRHKGIDKKIGDYIQKIIDRIYHYSPHSEIIIVGYLPVYYGGGCLNKKQQHTAKYISNLHNRTNDILKKVSHDNNIQFIDLSDINYTICNVDDTFIRVPGTTKGSNWHTTDKGHRKIAEKIRTLYPYEFKE